jgi:hypothetical protein
LNSISHWSPAFGTEADQYQLPSAPVTAGGQYAPPGPGPAKLPQP